MQSFIGALKVEARNFYYQIVGSWMPRRSPAFTNFSDDPSISIHVVGKDLPLCVRRLSLLTFSLTGISLVYRRLGS